MRLSQLRSERNGFAEARGRLAEPALLRECDGLVVMGDGEPRINLDRASKKSAASENRASCRRMRPRSLCASALSGHISSLSRASFLKLFKLYICFSNAAFVFATRHRQFLEVGIGLVEQTL
jgi:hypothetical protein